MSLTEASIPPATGSVAQLLADAGLTRGWVLGGGTSIALHLAHRTSRDMDLLLPRRGTDRIPAEMLVRRTAELVPPAELSVSLRTLTQVDCTIRGVLVSWIGYPFEFVDPLDTWRGIEVLSLRDAGALKAYTIGRRPAARDYVDLYHLFRSGLTVEEVVERARQIFVLDGEPVFDEVLFAKQLTYTDDLPDVDATMSEVRPPGARWGDIVGGLREISVRWYMDRADQDADG